MYLLMRIIRRLSCVYWRIVPEMQHLIQAYREAQDIHRMTASQVFQTPFDEVTDLQRRNAKAVNFGIVYGISSFGLSQDLSITRKEAAQYIESYFETYPGIKKFLDDSVAHAKEEGYAVTLFGRRRPVPELKSSNFMQRNFGERVAMNAPIQGTAADIMKIAMIGVNRELKEKQMKSRLILQVHDELLIETWKEEDRGSAGDPERRHDACGQIFPFRLKLTCIVEKTGMRQNRRRTDMRKIGITGGIGSGKSKVLDIFKCSVRCGDLPSQIWWHNQVQLPGEKCYQTGRGDVWERNFKS